MQTDNIITIDTITVPSTPQQSNYSGTSSSYHSFVSADEFTSDNYDSDTDTYISIERKSSKSKCSTKMDEHEHNEKKQTLPILPVMKTNDMFSVSTYFDKICEKIAEQMYNERERDHERERAYICLCVCNSENNLWRVLNNVRKLCKLFEEYVVIFYYDISTDNTLKLLQIFQESNPDKIIILNNQSGDANSGNDSENISSSSSRHNFFNRTANIANARNNILQHIRTFREQAFEYFIMMDANEYSCIGEIDTAPIREVFSMSQHWDAVSFDREAGYYDYWALSFSDSMCAFVYSVFHLHNTNAIVEKMKTEFARILRTYSEKSALHERLVPVYSAFNGFAIYKTTMFIDCKYSDEINLKYFPRELLQKQFATLKSSPSPILGFDCEHRHFHLQSINQNNSKIRVYPRSVFRRVTDLTKEELSKLRGPA